MRFYLIDRVTELVPNERVEAVKCWSLSDDIFEQHFPVFPVVPGTLAVESMAQALGVLIDRSYQLKFPQQPSCLPVLTLVHQAKFRRPLLPGDQAIIKGTLNTLDSGYATAAAKTYVKEELVASADLCFGLIPRDRFPGARLEAAHQEMLFTLCDAFKVTHSLNQ